MRPGRPCWRRRRRWRPKSLAGRSIAAAVAALVLLLLTWTIAYFATEQRLAKAVQRCRDLGMSGSWEEHVGPAIDDAVNAAVPLQEAGKTVQRLFDKVYLEESIDAGSNFGAQFANKISVACP